MAESTTVVRSLLNRMNLALRAGLQFGGARDLYSIFGYSRQIKYQDYKDKYDRQDLAGRIVNMPAEALWSYPPEVVGDDEFKAAWERVTRQTQLWSIVLQADKLLGLDRYVVLFLGLPGDPESPVKSADMGSLAYIHPYAANAAEVTSLVKDTSSPAFGSPEVYSIKLNSELVSLGKVKLHHTRAVHLINEPIDNAYDSAPRLQKGYNLLEDLLKVVGGSAETFWLTANRGMQVDVDRDMELSEADAQDLSAELDEFQHQLRRYIRTRGVKVNVLGTDVADPRGTFDTILSLLSGAYGIPQRILVGSEAGQLASEQDRANWAESIQQRRANFGEPQVLWPIVNRLVALKILPKPKETMKFEWPEAFHMSPLERGQTMAQIARAVGNLSRQNQYTDSITSREEARLIIGLPEKPKGKLIPMYQKDSQDKEPKTTDKPAEVAENPGKEVKSDKEGANG